MLKLNETVLYGTTGCCIVDRIEDKRLGKEIKKYYVLKPIAQSTSTVFVPLDNERLLSKIRRLLSADEISTMIKCVINEPDIWLENDNERKLKFGEIISSGDRKACLVLIRSLRNRQNELSQKGKRLHISDERAMKEAQRLISDEFAFVLGLKPEEVGTLLKEKIG